MVKLKEEDVSEDVVKIFASVRRKGKICMYYMELIMNVKDYLDYDV